MENLTIGKFGEFLDKIEMHPGRLDTISECANLYRECNEESIIPVSYMLQGKLIPDFHGLEIGVSRKTMEKVLSGIKFGVKPNPSDLGASAKEIIESEGMEISVKNVHGQLLHIAKITGSGSQSEKVEMLRKLLITIGGSAAKWVVRIILGKMRNGVENSTILKALSEAFGDGKKTAKSIEHAFYVCSDMGLVAQTIYTGGMDSINEFHARPFSPIMPMLAGRAKSTDEAIKKTKGTLYVESKLDGERVQIHVLDGKAKIFSRGGEEITRKYPDIIKNVVDISDAESFIIEGEAVAISTKDGSMLPFQELLHRASIHKRDEMVKKYPVKVFVFDILYIDDRPLLNISYSERKKILMENINESEMFIPLEYETADNSVILAKMLDDALADGAEGLMVKDGLGLYTAGSRGSAWIKIKREYMTGGETFDLAIIGALRGRGRRSGKYGAYVMGIKENGKYMSVCKVGTGFTDDDLDKLYQETSKFELDEKPKNVTSDVDADVWFDPSVVLEISAFEISRNDMAGFGLRFPVYVRPRPDKSLNDLTLMEDIKEAYDRQIKQI